MGGRLSRVFAAIQSAIPSSFNRSNSSNRALVLRMSNRTRVKSKYLTQQRDPLQEIHSIKPRTAAA